jgi:hypothetical protein
MSKKKIIFRGQISPIMSAIRMGGDVMRISFDVPLMERINAIGLLALTDQPLMLTVEVDKTATAAATTKKEKGEWGQYWHFMRKPDSLGCNFTTFPDIQEFLDTDSDADRVHEALRAYFKVDSLTTVSPEQFNQFVKDNGLSEGLITMSRNAEAKAAEKQGALVS